MDGNLDLNVLMEIKIVIMNQHQGVAKQGHKEKKVIMKGLKFLMNYAMKYLFKPTIKSKNNAKKL